MTLKLPAVSIMMTFLPYSIVWEHFSFFFLLSFIFSPSFLSFCMNVMILTLCNEWSFREDDFIMKLNRT